jgi:hypothetical protein
MTEYSPASVADMANPLRAGQHITLLKIDEMMAMTHRYEVAVAAPEPLRCHGYDNRQLRVAVVVQRGKRKRQYLDLRAEQIVLDGWDLPFKADTEGGRVWRGNACYNLVGDPDAIWACMETKAVFPICEQAKAKIFVSRDFATQCDDEAELLYPDIRTGHAVVNRFKEAHGKDF